MVALLLATLAGVVSSHFASMPEIAGLPRLWLWLFLSQLPLLGVAIYLLGRQGLLKERLFPRPGDVVRGVSVAAILIIAIWSGRALLMPHGSIREAWLARLYIQAGDPLELGRFGWVPVVILGWAISDEIIWRGWLQPLATKRFGITRGILILTAAYAVQTLPAAYHLADPSAGYNPLMPLLAACCGLCFSYITHLTGRITPSLIAHATLAYFTVLEFRPGL